MALKDKIKSALKRKVGGTDGGNFIRTLANVATKGILGNGVMMLKEDETPAENLNNAKNVAAENIGAAITGVTLNNKANDLEEKAKKGGIKMIAMIAIPILVIIVIVKMFTKKKKF